MIRITDKSKNLVQQFKYHFLTCLLSLIIGSVAGQQVRFEHVTTDDGLSQNSVISMTQDSLGFLWFATQDGLNKYDGSNFIKYEVFFRDITDNPINQLGKITVDSKGRLWMTTLDGGLQFYDPVTDRFRLIDEVKEASYIFQSDENEFYISSFSKGLYRLKEVQEDFFVEQIITDQNFSKVVKYGDHLLLIANEGLLKMNPSDLSQELLFSSIQNISDVEVYKTDQLLIATLDQGLFISEGLSKPSSFLDFKNNMQIQDVLVDRSDNVWLATYGDGVFQIKNNRTIQYKLNALDEESINYDDVLTIFQDRDGNIWFGTDGGGASYILKNRKPIYGLTNNQMPENIPVDVVRSISKDRLNNLWIGTSGKGLTKISEDFTNIKHFSADANNNSGLTSSRIMSLLHDENQNLWVGTQDGGLLLKEAGENIFKQVNPELPAKTIWGIKQVDQDHLWLCSRNEGLICFDINDYSWEKISAIPEYEDLINGNVRTIISGPNNSFFVGTDNGRVYSLDENRKATKLELNDGLSGAIKAMYLDDDKLWIGTQKSGLLIYDLVSKKYQQLDNSSGLPNNVVYSILPHNDNSVWVSTNSGICQLNKHNVLNIEENIVNQHLTAENGLVCNEFNTGAYFKDEDGVMYFGGIGGINWFSPDQILKDYSPVNIVLLDLITTDQDGSNVKHISNLNSVNLNRKERNFQIKYVAQTYAKTNTKYRYKLEGINEEWVNNESNELVSFSNIPPGEYTLLLNATNNDGLWNKTPVQFRINVVAAFWETTWFRILCAALLFGLAWLLYHLRVNELKRTSALKEQISKVEAKALKLQMNPHFLFNSLNAIDNYILKNEKIKASDYLSKFSKLMRQILDYSEQGHITLTQELETLELYINMEQLRFQERFDYNFNIESAVNTSKVKVPPLILQPFVENAIWHGLMHLEDGGELNIDILEIGDTIKCIIDDNGIGRKKAEEINTKSVTKHKSFGMRITEKRLALNNDLNKVGASVKVIDKYHDDGASAGTSIELNFPSQ